MVDCDPSIRGGVLELGESAVQYLCVSGDSAIAVAAIDDETVTWFLDQLP